MSDDLEYPGRLRPIFGGLSDACQRHVVEAAAPMADACDEIENCLEPLFASSLGG